MAKSSETTEDLFETNDEICQQLVEEFVSMTQTDEALAQFYCIEIPLRFADYLIIDFIPLAVQDRNWNLRVSVNDYFEQISNQSSRKRTFDEVVVDSSDGDSDDCNVVFVNKKPSKVDPKTSSSEPNEAKVMTEVKKFVYICWNIDGIDEKNLRIRTEAVLESIKAENALIVFLQEVVNQSEAILRQSLPEYEFLSGRNNSVDYYVMTLVHKNYVKLITNEIIDFNNSSMGRNVLKTRVTIGGAQVCLLNTHLESTKDFADFRVQQLNTVFKEISKVPNNESVIFGGDLNLRDKEYQISCPSKPSDLYDVWVKTGSRKEVEYTWDLLRNDNLEFNGSKFKPRFRFDRVFVRPSVGLKIDAIHFGLIGLNRLKPYVCFPSDHWGLRVYFEVTE